MTHPHPKRSFVPQAVLTRSGKLSTAGIVVNTVRSVNTANTKAVNTANTKAVKTVRSVNTATSKPIVNYPRTKTNAFKRGYSQSSRPFKRHFANKNNIINTNVNTARLKHTTARDRAVIRENKGKGTNTVKSLVITPHVLDTVMSDSEDSTVTYTAVSSPFEDGSDIGSPGVDGPPIMPEDPYAYIMAAYEVPPSPDYIPGPEIHHMEIRTLFRWIRKSQNAGTKMPSEYQQDYKKTRAYALKIYNDPNMSNALRNIYRTLESRYVREGGTIDPSFYNDLSG
ncbi:hypothetical protein Tco_0013499 [Tanacetum coccineum]